MPVQNGLRLGEQSSFAALCQFPSIRLPDFPLRHCETGVALEACSSAGVCAYTFLLTS